MKLNKILEKLEYKCAQGSLDIEVNDVIYDSRKVTKGTLFLCLVGANADGHDYIKNAIEKGAGVIVAEREVDIPEGVTLIIVRNTRIALSYLSAALFGYPDTKMTTIAITGTKGKTTTAFMIRNILQKAGHKTGMIGTVGVFINEKYTATKNTTPESYDIHKYFSEMVNDGCEYVVMEVSSQALMVGRCAGITFDYGIYTNIAPDHIGENEHKDFEDYLYCKSLLFKQCIHGIFNFDDEHAGDMMKNATCDIKTYGFNKKADLHIEFLEYLMNPGFIGIAFHTGGILEDDFEVGTPGKFSAYNALAALAVTDFIGTPRKCIKEALYENSVKGRVESVKISDDFTLLIDYAHNAMSMESLLTTIREYKPKRIVSLFGCGGNRSKLRRYEMGEISGKLADLSILTADNSRFEEVEDIIADIIVGISKTNGKYVVIPDRKEAIKYSILNAKPGDIVLLLGKGHEDYQEIKGKRFPFDERVVINEILEEIGWH